MATSKLYSYFIEGGKLGLVEYDEATGVYKSPLSDVSSGLELDYVKEPSSNKTQGAILSNLDTFSTSTGFLVITNSSGNDWSESDIGIHIEITNCAAYPELNGIYKFASIVTATPTAAKFTPISSPISSVISNKAISELGDVTIIDYLEDEESIINLDENLSRALTYYVRARLMEDQGNIQMKEYWMREYNRLIAEYDDKRIWGPRIVVPNSHAIKK